MTNERKFMTIREESRAGYWPESGLRRMQKEGKLPGVYSGGRFMVNIPLLVEMLDSESQRNGGMSCAR